MSGSFYSKRLRYGNMYNDGGYVSDGGYHAQKSASRLNKSRSVEDLTSTRPNISERRGVPSSRSFADVYGTSSARGSRFLSDTRPTRASYRSTDYTNRDRDDQLGRAYGSRESLIDLSRGSSFDRHSSRPKQSGSLRRGDTDGRARVDLTVGEVSGASNKYRQESPNKVKYRISGEIIRDTTSADEFKGYHSDTGLLSRGRRDASGYESERGYGRKSNPSYRDVLDKHEEKSFKWRSLSQGRSKNESDFEVDRRRRESGQYRYDGRDRETEDQRRFDSDFGPRQGKRSMGIDDLANESLRPRSRSPSPMRRPVSSLSAKSGSPNRRARKGSNMPMELANSGDIDASAIFPVCSRWPNCTVCSIDIPNSQVVSI